MSYPNIICSYPGCGRQLEPCWECLAQDWWYLYCSDPKHASMDYDHKHDANDSGERRYRWEPARRKERTPRMDLRTDEEGRVRVRVFLVDETRSKGSRAGQLKLGNRQRTVTIRRARVNEIADAIERALFSPERRMSA